jgi:Carboxypeptidase regulatory-like domain
MATGLGNTFGLQSYRGQLSTIMGCCTALLLLAQMLTAQTAATGALKGIITDPSGGVVPGVPVKITSHATGETRTAISQSNGSYLVSLLSPGDYSVDASAKGFKSISVRTITIHVTETETLDLRLQLGTITETITVQDVAELIQTNSSALGSVTDQRMVENLPLVTRNYTQILGLSPGVSGEVNNSASIGRGDSSQAASVGGYSIAGNATNDNNFQMNGAEVNDLIGEGNISGGIPVPNPDSIQEFKVQTGQYDASYGRNAGANVDVVTKSGTNTFHGDVWEYFRNTDLNANDYFLKQQQLAAGEPQQRAVLSQNQFGFTLGGPILKNKVMFFVSYQGTRERDGLDSTVGCLTTGFLPPGLTNEASSRTAAALAQEFQGQAGALGGTVTSAASISPAALAVLNAQLPNGNLLVPPPQNAATGTSTLSTPCAYTEDQFVNDLDIYQTQKSHFAGKFFFMNSDQTAPFPSNQFGLVAASLSGFPQTIPNGARDFSLTHTYSFNDHLINQAVIGFHRTTGNLGQGYPKVNFANGAGCGAGPFNLSSICVPAPAFDNPFPDVIISGTLGATSTQPIAFNLGGNGQGVDIAQNFYDISDSLTYVRGPHSLHFGGGINRSQINLSNFHYFGGLYYLTFADFLLGQPILSIDVPGVFNREWRVWDGNLYLQDDYKVTRRLTLNLGFRYERQGQLGEYLGRASTFDPAQADPDPPATGSLQGFIVASNFSGGTIPPGVIKAGTNTAIDNDGQNGWEPRLGFAWQLPGTNRLVLRGGYGIFYTRTTGEPFIQLLGAPPWGEIRQFEPPTNFAAPFPPLPAFPVFLPYTPPVAPSATNPLGQPLGSDLEPTAFSLHFRAPILQRYSLNLQTAIANNWMLEVGYQGARGTKLLQNRSFNQALLASPSNPIRGQTTNTVTNPVTGAFGNVGYRVPVEGMDPAHSLIVESAGASWYNALGASLSKRFSKGLQFLASYTLASALETNPGYATGGFAGGTLLGDQNSPRANYGPDAFIRPQRLVISYVYEFPSPTSHSFWSARILGGWSVAGVTTFQNGQRLTMVDTNLLNAFGINSSGGDRVQLTPGCTNKDVETPGSVTSKLTNYVNASCFTLPPIIGSDGLATGFGDSGNGIISGPDQRNFDISIIKKTPITERTSLEFRAEFFNAFNTPSFGFPNPELNVGTVAPSSNNPGSPSWQPNPTGGQITSASVAPRVIQFALKVYF